MFSPKQLNDFVTQYVRPVLPEHEPDLLLAIKSIDSGQPVSDQVLSTIESSASDHRRNVYETCTYILAQLAVQDVRALAVVAKMAAASTVDARHNAILCLRSENPSAHCESIVRAALNDKTPRVRCKAADWAGRLRLRSVVPDLERAVQQESNKKTREVMCFELELLRDGFVSRQIDDSSTSVTVLTPTGRLSRAYSTKDVEARGFKAILAEIHAS